jgi:UDP-N-acetylmuramoyl-L-alanyl-D-glutamate--2,6-diaminopimelate ligase
MEQELIRENKRAEAVLALAKKILPSQILDLVRPIYHYCLALTGGLVYRFPSRNLTVVGITGTKGKSTVVEMIGAILREAKMPAATLSSLYYWIKENSWPNTLKMTVPGRFKLQGFIRKAADYGVKYLVLEMTSEGIKQSRHRFIKFDIAAITNLHPEHIEAHGSFEKYRACKGKLFGAAKSIHVVNSDNRECGFFLQFKARKKILFGLNTPQNVASNHECILASDASFTKAGSKFSIGEKLFTLNLVGRFNISNALCAIAVSRALNISWEAIQNALSKFPRPPGRLEFVEEGQAFEVVIDFAHTPDSLAEVYGTIQELFPKTEIITVLGGTGGGRDKWKRPLMGEIAMKHSKKVFFTNEDPYDEDPASIIDQVAKGVENLPQEKRNFEKVLDRKVAIQKALSEAKPGDTVVITGKGGEQVMAVAGGKKIPWSDLEIAKEALKKIVLKKL